MWEYKVVDLRMLTEGEWDNMNMRGVVAEQILNEMGLLGWELISIDRQRSSVDPSIPRLAGTVINEGLGFAYFKRPLK